MADVYVDEKYIGSVADPRDFVMKLRDERRNSRLPSGLNVFFDEKLNEVHLELSKGRTRRPLIVIENGASKLTKDIKDKVVKGE